jgi:hypothetical protein
MCHVWSIVTTSGFTLFKIPQNKYRQKFFMSCLQQSLYSKNRISLCRVVLALSEDVVCSAARMFLKISALITWSETYPSIDTGTLPLSINLFSHLSTDITVIIFLKFPGKQVFVYQLFHGLGIDTDPDRPNLDWHAMDADPDPDPTKWCGSVLIRIHNSA